MIKTNIVIIGAGIAGVSAAIYLKRANCNFIIIEKNQIGGKLNELQTVENFPALGNTTGLKIKEDLDKQIRDLGISITYGNVQTILKDPAGFKVVSDVDSFLCEKVICATGISMKKPGIAGEIEYFGRGVSYCAVCDGNFFKNLPVAVIGNHNIAFEEALYLANLASKVYLISDSELVGDDDLIKKVKLNEKIDLILGSKVKEIKGNEFSVSSLLLEDREISVSGVFPYFGEKTSSEILRNLNPMMKNNCAIVDENMESNIKGLYFAGDIVSKNLKQLITAVSDGAIAAVNASKVNI